VVAWATAAVPVFSWLAPTVGVNAAAVSARLRSRAASSGGRAAGSGLWTFPWDLRSVAALGRPGAPVSPF